MTLCSLVYPLPYTCSFITPFITYYVFQNPPLSPSNNFLQVLPFCPIPWTSQIFPKSHLYINSSSITPATSITPPPYKPKGSCFQVRVPATRTVTVIQSNIPHVPETQPRADDCAFVQTREHLLETVVTKYPQVNQTSWSTFSLSLPKSILFLSCDDFNQKWTVDYFQSWS